MNSHVQFLYGHVFSLENLGVESLGFMIICIITFVSCVDFSLWEVDLALSYL